MIDRLATTGRLRALDPDEKAARREALLAAAERLSDRTLQLPSVASLSGSAARSGTLRAQRAQRHPGCAPDAARHGVGARVVSPLEMPLGETLQG
jgi:hypothetical protein